jgi:hypothetical protein
VLLCRLLLDKDEKEEGEKEEEVVVVVMVVGLSRLWVSASGALVISI